MSFANSSPSVLLADQEWRRKNSRWRWWVFLGFGLLGCIGFLIIASRVQSKKFWTAATVASVGSAACWLAVALSGETSDTATSAAASKTSDTASDGSWGGGVAIAIWVAQIVLAVLINRDYLRWKADSNNEWYNQPVAPGATNFGPAPMAQPSQAGTPPQTPFLGVDTGAYFAGPPATQVPPPPTPASKPVAATPPPPTRAPIDINTASPGEIAVTVGVDDDVVKRIVDARIQRGGFRGLDDLASAAGLQPHEMLKFRDKVAFGGNVTRPSSTSPAAPQPSPPTEPGSGRILDV